MNKEKQTYNPCDDCQYSYSKNNQESGMCKICEFVYFRDRQQSEGKWEQTTEPMGWHDVDCVECSACGESWVLDEDFDYDVVKDFWKYCPNCGAKMKGGE